MHNAHIFSQSLHIDVTSYGDEHCDDFLSQRLGKFIHFMQKPPLRRVFPSSSIDQLANARRRRTRGSLPYDAQVDAFIAWAAEKKSGSPKQEARVLLTLAGTG